MHLNFILVLKLVDKLAGSGAVVALGIALEHIRNGLGAALQGGKDGGGVVGRGFFITEQPLTAMEGQHHRIAGIRGAAGDVDVHGLQGMGAVRNVGIGRHGRRRGGGEVFLGRCRWAARRNQRQGGQEKTEANDDFIFHNIALLS